MDCGGPDAALGIMSGQSPPFLLEVIFPKASAQFHPVPTFAGNNGLTSISNLLLLPTDFAEEIDL